MMWRRLGAVVLAAATFGASWTMGMAVADPPEPRLVLSDVGATSATPIEIDDMYPGLAVTRPYTVALTATAPDANLALAIEALVDLERACNRPETQSGDTSCGEFDGEMSEQLLLSALLTDGDDCEDTTEATSVLAPTTLRDAATIGVLDLGAIVESGTERCLLLTFDLPRAADNLVQSDLARFDLVVHAEQAIPDPAPSVGRGTDVLADVLERPAPVGPATVVKTIQPATVKSGQLAITGLLALPLLLAATGSLALGGLVLWVSRRRGRAR